MKSYLTSFVCIAVMSTCSLAAAADANAPAETVDNRVAVTVNGIDITEAAVDAEVAQRVGTMRIQPPPRIVDKIKEQVLDKMIVELLLDEKIKANKITATEEDITAYINEMLSQQGLTMEDFKALLKAQGKTFEQWKQQMKFRKGLGYQKLMEAQWADKINVTEQDAKKYYSENAKQFETPEQVKASHILIKPDTSVPDTDPNEAKAKAKAKTQDLLKQIKAGADFATLAKEHSDCPSASRGGDLGFFDGGRMVPAFAKAAFELKVGQVSDIVETRFGYHIIKVTDHKDAGVVQFAEAKDDITKMLKTGKQQEFTKKYVESLKAEANIVYPPGKEPGAVSLGVSPAKKVPPSLKSLVESQGKAVPE